MIDLRATLVPMLAEHYPGMDLDARWVAADGIEITQRGNALCWIDGDVVTEIARGDLDAIEIVFDEIDNVFRQRKKMGN